MESVYDIDGDMGALNSHKIAAKLEDQLQNNIAHRMDSVKVC